MYQVADNQFSETIDLLIVIQSLWNGMVPLVGVFDYVFVLRSAVEVLILQKI